MTEERQAQQQLLDVVGNSLKYEAELFYMDDVSPEFRKGAAWIVERMQNQLKSTAYLLDLRYPPLKKRELRLLADHGKEDK